LPHDVSAKKRLRLFDLRKFRCRQKAPSVQAQARHKRPRTVRTAHPGAQPAMTSLAVSELGRHIGADKTSIGRVAEAMIDRGLLNNTLDPEDRRVIHLSMGRKGRYTLSTTARFLADVMEVSEGF
jgi:DNA-binding MarR family transcriptional regulator